MYNLYHPEQLVHAVYLQFALSQNFKRINWHIIDLIRCIQGKKQLQIIQMINRQFFHIQRFILVVFMMVYRCEKTAFIERSLWISETVKKVFEYPFLQSTSVHAIKSFYWRDPIRSLKPQRIFKF